MSGSDLCRECNGTGVERDIVAGYEGDIAVVENDCGFCEGTGTDFGGATEHQQIRVLCPTRSMWLDESTVEVLNIEEAFDGRDVLTFKCPECEQTHKSGRVGRSYE